MIKKIPVTFSDEGVVKVVGYVTIPETGDATIAINDDMDNKMLIGMADIESALNFEPGLTWV